MAIIRDISSQFVFQFKNIFGGRSRGIICQKNNLIIFVCRKYWNNVPELCGKISVNEYNINGKYSLFGEYYIQNIPINQTRQNSWLLRKCWDIQK